MDATSWRGQLALIRKIVQAPAFARPFPDFLLSPVVATGRSGMTVRIGRGGSGQAGRLLAMTEIDGAT